MRSLCVRLHPIIVIVTAEPGGPPTEVSACSGGKHSVRELALPSKLKWWVGWWVGWVAGQNCVADQCHLTDTPSRHAVRYWSNFDLL